jgi:hypothetical protein
MSFPILAVAPLAASLVNRLIDSFHTPRAPQTASTTKPDFSKDLAAEMKKKETKNVRADSIQSLIALQQGAGPLKPEIQAALTQQLLNKKVQVLDDKGNNVVGFVNNAHWQGGQIHLNINGKTYPLSSLQAVLKGV